ncbi:unnamed protein product [Anisakis simplex]|uniref:Transthyretin-like family protein n=1 Tax=Anisakis simplex TaxID=6269 RepID=A0A0M3JWI3_ANISI|nr:unnamed protein product [Anisakis simplex]
MALQFVGLIIALIVIDGTSGRVQRFFITGRLVCGTRPSAEQLITLYDYDTFSRDDKMGVSTSDKDGKFKVFGQEDEVFAVEPFITITHDCEGTSHDGKVGNVYMLTDMKCQLVMRTEDSISSNVAGMQIR